MDTFLTHPELLKQGGSIAGWLVAIFMFLVWRRSETSHLRSQKVFEGFARAAIRNVDATYGKRRQLDQLLAEALAQARAQGEGHAVDRHLAKALAHMERNGR